MADPDAAAEAPAPVSAQVVGNAFVQQYYHILQQSPGLVHRFYHDISKLGRPEEDGSMSTTTTMDAINAKILSHNCGDFKAEIKSVDAQESLNGAVSVLVTGYMTGMDNIQQQFTQSFFLAPQDKGYFVLSDMFRYMNSANNHEEDHAPAEDVVAPATPEQVLEVVPVLENDIPEQAAVLTEEAETEQAVPVENGEVPTVEKDQVPEVVDEVQDSLELEVESHTKFEEMPKKSYASIGFDPITAGHHFSDPVLCHSLTMGDKSDQATAANQPVALHPVYTVTDIQKKVRVLDGTKVTYSAWVKLFNLHARGYEVVDHITSDPPPEDDPSYASWMKIDAVVLQWIYNTLSEDYLLRVLEEPSTARQAWNRVKDIFHNNKGPRCAALQTRFVNLKLSSMPSLDAYCQALRDLAAQLADVDNPVNEQTLVLQLVRGLPREFDTIASIINRELPSWNEACEMLRGDMERQAARDGPVLAAASEAHVVVNSNRRDNPNRDNKPRRDSSTSNRYDRNRDNNHFGNNQSGYGNSSHNRSGSGTHNRNPNHSHPAWNPSYYPPMPPPAWLNSFRATAPPPCPYPTQPGWVSPWNNASQPQQPPVSENSASQAHVTDVNPLEPTELAEAFNTMAVGPDTPSWFMDTGASDHLTRDSVEGYSVYIKGLPMNATHALVEEEFKKFGPIKPNGIQVRNNRQQGFSFGFVEFEVLDAVQKAIEASPILINGKNVVIEEKRSTISKEGNRGRFVGGRGPGFRGRLRLQR